MRLICHYLQLQHGQWHLFPRHKAAAAKEMEVDGHGSQLLSRARNTYQDVYERRKRMPIADNREPSGKKTRKNPTPTITIDGGGFKK